MDIPVHREGCRGVSETHLYLLRTDLLFGKERRVRVLERMKTQVSWQVQALLEIGKDMRHSGQRHRLGLVFERVEDVVVLCERNVLPQEAFREFLPP